MSSAVLQLKNNSTQASTLKPSVEEQFAEGAVALDPVFVSLRRKHFDPRGLWQTFDSLLQPTLAKTELKLGPISFVGFTSAFGWEQRPWTQDGVLTESVTHSLTQALAQRNDWDLCEINGLSTVEISRLKQACLQSGNALIDYESVVRVIPGQLTYEQYFNNLSPHVRKQLKKSQRRMNDSGLSVRHELGWNAIERLLDSKKIHAPNLSDYTKSAEFRSFWREYREELKASGRLFETGIYKDLELVAFVSGFKVGNVVHLYQTAYDYRFAKLGLGTQVIATGIQQLLNDRVCSLIDLMSDTNQLRAIAPETAHLRRALVCSNRMRGRMLATLLFAKKSFKSA